MNSLQMQMIVGVLQAFADANGLKMPSAEVLDGVEHEIDRVYAGVLRDVVTSISNTSQRASEDQTQAPVGSQPAAEEGVQAPA